MSSGTKVRNWVRRGGFALLLIAAALGCQDKEARFARHMQRGAAYLEESKPKEAVIEYRNAVQIDPNNASAHYALAQAFLAARQPAKAYWELHETVRLDPENHEARLAYGNFLLFGEDDQKERALEQADAVVAAQPESWQARLLRGRSLEGLGRDAEAREAFEAALELAPEQPEVVGLVGNHYLRAGDADLAEAQFQKLVEIQPTVRSYFALAAFYARERRVAEAERVYRDALGVAEPDERGLAYRRLASFYYGEERYDEAEATLVEAREADGKDLEVLYALARFYHARGAPERADQIMEEATQADPGQIQPYLALSSYRSQNGDYAGALSAVELALDVDPKAELARLRKAELLVDQSAREGKPESLAQARAIVDAVIEDNPDSPEAFFVRAKIEIAGGELAQAETSLRTVIDARPDSAQAHYLLASTLRATGDRPEARVEAQRALELDASLDPARMLLARLHSELGEHQAAVDEAGRVLRKNPGSEPMRLLAAQSLVHLGDRAGARRELEVIPLGDRSADVHFALARLDLLDGKPAFARDKLVKALEQEPYHPEVLAQYLNAERRLGNTDAAIARIETAVAERPQDGDLARLYGMALLVGGRGSAAEDQLRRAVELAPDDMASYQALASYYLATQRFAEGVEAYEEAVEKRPQVASLRFALGTLYEVDGRRADAVIQYEEALRVNPNMAVAKNNLAYVLAEQEINLDRALDLAREAKQALPDNPNAADTLGWVLYKKGLHGAAIDFFKEAEANSPIGSQDLGVIRYHLALAYEGNGELEEARATLERALATAPQSAESDQPTWATDARSMLARLGS